MVSFKLCISEPSTGRTFQKEVKDTMARPFVGLNIGEAIKGDNFELGGYEFQITGGSDYCGFPMRKGILGQRKKITIYGGVGFRGAEKGIQRRKTVCGHKIHENISQINLKVLKAGSKKLNEIFGVAEESSKDKSGEKGANPAKEEKKGAKENKAEAMKEKKGAEEEKRGQKTEEKQESMQAAEKNKE